MTRALLLIAALIVPVAGVVAGLEKTPWVVALPRVTSEPGWVNLKIRIAPDDSYRTLTVEIDSPAFFRSSLIPLNGADSPSTYWLRFEGLPAGEYIVRIRVNQDGDDSLKAETGFRVV